MVSIYINIMENDDMKKIKYKIRIGVRI